MKPFLPPPLHYAERLWVSRREPGFREPEARIGLLERLGDMQVLVRANDLFHYDVNPDQATSVCRSHNNVISTGLRKYIGRFDSSNWQYTVTVKEQARRRVRELLGK